VFSLTPFFTPSDDDVANSPLWGISETAVWCSLKSLLGYPISK
jgi:hypothetical protein